MAGRLMAMEPNLPTRLGIGATIILSALGNSLFFNRRPLDAAAVRKVLIVQTRISATSSSRRY